MEIRVLTANLWGLPWPVSRDRVGRKERFAEFLARLSPDIVVAGVPAPTTVVRAEAALIPYRDLVMRGAEP